MAVLCAVVSLAGSAHAEGPPAPRPTGLLADHDRRTPKEPDAWPWTSIGKVNVVFGSGRRGSCTGTLIAPDKVATAAHCVINQATGRWADPAQIHFVAGVARDRSIAHGRVASIGHAPDLEPAKFIAGAKDVAGLTSDWAVLTLTAPLSLKPVPLRPLTPDTFAAAVAEGETARAGYAADRPFLLSLQMGCAVAPLDGAPGLLRHDCDTMPGDSGSPILLLKDEEASVIGVATGVTSHFTPGVGHRAGFGIGVPAASLAGAVR